MILISLAVVLYAVVSGRLARTPVSGPTLFMALGIVLGPAAFGVIEGAEDLTVIEVLLEVALALILFTDALGISAGGGRVRAGLPTRLLLIGLPLTLILGAAVAAPMFPGLDLWEAALLAICLAPTDAALGQAVVTDERVPASIRQALNIESGLNDGLVLPFFILVLAGAVESEGGTTQGAVEVVLRSLVYAAVVGAAVGWGGARLLSAARAKGWLGPEWTQIATLALVLLAFGVADVGGGSGFIAAWVAGLVFGRTRGDEVEDAPVLAEDLGGLLSTVSFLGFGAVLLGPMIGRISWQAVAYAALSLTVIRMLPVAVAMLGRGYRATTMAFAGWFGPRGLASIVFALLVAEEVLPGGGLVVEVVFTTVAISVLLHGATAVAGARRYGAWFRARLAAGQDLVEAEEVDGPSLRRRLAVRDRVPPADP
jgi:NhaP-type Na+/H+ or K+/H+ antiporter